MQLAHLKTSPVVVLGPLELLEWPNETFAVGQHHQFSVTKEPLASMYGAQSIFIYQGMNTWNAVCTSQNLPSTCFRTTGITTMAKSRFCCRRTSPV